MKENLFVHLPENKQIISMCLKVQEEHSIGLVLGKYGIGKTTAVKRFVIQTADAVYVRPFVGWSLKWFSNQLAKEVGYQSKLTIQDTFDLLLGVFKEKRRWVIVVDEADSVIHKAGIIEGLRYLHDRSGVALILVGDPETMLPALKTYGPFMDRVRHKVEVGEMTTANAALIVQETSEVPFTEDAASGLITFLEERKMRELVHAITKIETLAKVNKWDTVDLAKLRMVFKGAANSRQQG
jgi:DNA transposition AAA+ family ATPase